MQTHEDFCIPAMKYNVGLCWCDMEEVILLIDDKEVDEDKLKEIRRKLRLKQTELRKRIEYYRKHPEETIPNSEEGGKEKARVR